MLYHASETKGLQMLRPHRSTHGKAYVYAITDPVTAVCFGAPKDDFDLLMDERDGRPVLNECYPGALRRVYAGKACSLYTVPDDGFLQGKTGWDAEMVCEDVVAVLQEQEINDIYEYLMRAADKGDCIINLYSEDEKYIAMLREELTERIRFFGLTKEQMHSDWRFQCYFSQDPAFKLTEQQMECER